MKRTLIALSLGAALIGVSACASGYYGPGPGPQGGVFYEHNPVAYDGYYDDFYGPFYDGYWGDGGFYYSTGEGRPYVRDEGNHFRHESMDGMHSFHGGMHTGGGHGGPHHG